MKFPWRKSLRYTGLAVLLALLLGILCLQTLPSLFGYPAWVSKTIAEAITPKDGSCSMGAIHGGIFTGFEIENFSLEAPTETGVFQLTVPAVGFDLRLGSLLIGHIQPKEAYVRNAELQLLLPGDETHPQDSLSLRQFTGNIHITSYHVLQAQARGIFQGTQLNADATLLGIHDLRQFLSPDEKGSSLPQNLVETLKDYHQEFNNITERAYDSFLSVSLTANPEEWSQCTLQGTVGISDATICGLLLPTVRGAFTYQENLLNVQDFQILYDATETLAGKGVLDLTRKTFRGSFWADLMPATFIQMLSLPADILPRNLRFNTPIHFSCDLPDSPCDLAKLSPDLFFSCDNILVSDLRLNKLSGLICFDKNILDLKNLQLYVGATAEEIINGNCTLDLNTKLLSGNFHGTINLCEMLHSLNLVESRNTPLEAFTRAKLEASLAKSPVDDWKLWQAKAALSQNTGAIAKIPLQNMRLDAAFEEQMIRTEFSATIADDDIPNRISLKAKTFVDDDFANKPMTITLEPEIQVRNESALNITGKAILDLQEHTFQIDDGIADVRPELLQTLLQKPLQLDDESVLSYFVCRNPQKPAHLTFYMPPFSWRNAKETWDWEKTPWKICGETTMEDMTLLDTDFSRLHSSIVLTEQNIDFPDLNGELTDGLSSTTGHLNIRFSPFALFYDDLHFQGSPIGIASLLFGDTPIEIYKDVWKDFSWSEDTPAKLYISHMEYRAQPNSNGIFLLDGNVLAQNFHFQDLPVKELTTDVHIDLPDEGLRLTNIRLLDLLDSDTPLTGNVSLNFRNGIAGTFHSLKEGGNLRISELLSRVFPALANDLSLFDLPPEANFSCDGRFRIDNGLTLTLNGTLETPYMQYRTLQLQNLKGTWSVSNHNFLWNFPTAEFYGGSLATTGVYDFDLSSSEVLASVKDIPVAKLVQLSSKKLVEKDQVDATSQKYADGELPGKINANGHFRILRNWAAQPLYVEGTGSINIHEADLWRVPTLTTLGKIIAGGTLNLFSKDKIASLGRISQLDADFDCYGQTIAIQNLRTDGSFIGLKGEGTYRLNDKQMNFQVSSKLFQSVSFVSWLLRPLTWAFEAELTGTPEQHEWHMKNIFKKIFE